MCRNRQDFFPRSTMAPLCLLAMLTALAVVLVTTLPTTCFAAEEPVAAPPTARKNSLQQSAERAFAARQWSEAVKAYRKLLASRTDTDIAWFRLGFALHAMGRLDEAILAHQRAAQFPRFRATALYNLACAKALQGEKTQALAHLEQAIAAGFRSPRPLSQDADLASLRGQRRFVALEKMARPLRQRDVYRQLDFWVGTWEVLDKKGRKLGVNVVTSDEQGMLLTEHWASQQGGTGTSLNFFNPAEKMWNQVWVDSSGVVTRCRGKLTAGGVMKMQGEIIDANGKTELSRLTLAPLENGRIHQRIERSSDGGKTWAPFFNGYYRPLSNATAGKKKREKKQPQER